MNITKIKIKNLYGIKEYEADGRSVELSGKNGTGKSSVLDAIKYALTNKSNREYIVHNGETEGEIIVETDTGLSIDRKARTNKADYKSVKRNGLEVGSPEAFLRELFTPLQLNPIEFMNMDKKQQNAIILDMIEYPWDMSKIKEWFGEIPAWVSYDQNILCVLNDIQAENGDYYQNRRNIDRDIRNKKAFVEELAASIPPGYDVEKWENASVGDIYRQIERIQKENQLIERAKMLRDSRESKIRKFDADREIDITALEREIANRANQIEKSIASLEEQIREYQKEKEQLASKKQDKLEVIEQTYKANVAKYDAEVAEYVEYMDKEPGDVTALQEQAREIENMQSHINEYKRMLRHQEEIAEMQNESQQLTDKIEKDYVDVQEKQGESWAVSVMDLSTQAYSTVNAEVAMKSASVIKAFIMAAVYDKMVYPDGEDTASAEYESTLKPLLAKMITVSDNDAANELVRQLGNGDFAAGAAVVNEFCQEREYTSTHLGREFLAKEPTDDNYVSASDCCRLLSDIYNGTLVNEKADSDMLELLKGQTVKTKIPVGVPDGVKTANKTGELSDAKLGVVENDIAIVFDATHPYVIAVLSNGVKSNSEAQNTIAKISKDVYEFMASQK